jgi:hypothetical protein
MPYYSVHVAGGLLLDGGEQVVGVASLRCLRMSEGLCSVHDTSQEQHLLAVLRRGKVMKGSNPAAAGG